MSKKGEGKTIQWVRDHVAYQYDEWCLIWPFSTTRGYGVMGRAYRIGLTSGTPCPRGIPAFVGNRETAMSRHQIEKLWREVGLPEYFLGNGGTNEKLYALYDRIVEDERERCALIAVEFGEFPGERFIKEMRSMCGNAIADKIREASTPPPSDHP